MSTPKLNIRNSSVTIKRDFSGQRIPSREKPVRDTEDLLMKKRFKIQPYSSFEDKFIEQDKLNHYLFEQLSKIDLKLSSIRPIIDQEDMSRDLQFLQNRVQTIFSEFEHLRASSKDYHDFKAAVIKKVGNVDEFKGKSSEKDKVLFEEVVRLGHVLENCEQDIENLKSKAVQPGKVEVLSQSFEDVEEKLRSMEVFYNNLRLLIDKESSKIMKISQSNSVLAKEIESYMSQMSKLVSRDLASTSDEMYKRLLDEQEIRQKNTFDLKCLLETNASQLTEKVFAEMGLIKSQLKGLDSLVFRQNSYIETLKSEFLMAAKNEKSEVLALVSGLDTTFTDQNKKLSESFSSLKNSQEVSYSNFSATIYAEMQTRVQAEHELQNMIKVTTKSIFQEIQELQTSFTEFKAQNAVNESEIRGSVSEKCDLLSRYVESEVKKVKSVITNNIKKYKSSVPRDIDLKVNQTREDFTSCLKALRDELSTNIKNTQDHFTNIINKTQESLNAVLKNLYKDLDLNTETIQTSLEKLDKRICEVDESSYKDLTQISEFINELDENIKEIQADSSAYQEIIAKLETQIEVKLVNEKCSREHAISFFYQTLAEKNGSLGKKIANLTNELQECVKSSEVVEKVKVLNENYIEVSKALELFRENIKGEMNDFFAEANQIKEQVEVNEVIIDEMKEKLNEINESYQRFGAMLRNSLKDQDNHRHISESKNVLSDLTNRVETMGILGKLDQVLVEMDANEKETQAMLRLYEKELVYLQERQKKGLEEAQNAVRGIFDAKIAGLQSMVSSEMDRILKYIEENKVVMPDFLYT